MSRIRKALGELQNAPGFKPGGEQGASAGKNTEGDRLPVRPSNANERTSNAGEQAGIAEDTSQRKSLRMAQSVHLDINQLRQAGLIPANEDVQVIAQQFRRIKRPILQVAFGSDLPKDGNSNVIMMASAMPGAGKSFCAFNLAYSIAMERDYDAVLVDADVLKPETSRHLGLEGNIGLIDYLLDPSLELADILVETDMNGISVIPAGRQDPQATELLASRRMHDLISLLSRQFASHAVVFDAPPLLLTSEAQVLAQIVGQIVLIIEARVTSQESAIRALGMLDRRKPINAILNKSRNAAVGGYHGDDYGYYPYPGKE